MSNESVIDNKNAILLDELKNILLNTNRASIAVGYFFISGFAAIMDSFTKIEASDNPDHIIRLLISPVTNRITTEALLANNESLEDAQRMVSTSNPDSKKIVATQVKNTLGHMPQTDAEYKAVLKLSEMIRNKKMQVKVYKREQLHAKAYIFELDNRQLPLTAIVGSSNLSISGIKEHTELNLRTNDKDIGEKLLDWFNDHWDQAEEFTDDMADIIEQCWIKARTPLEIYQKAVTREHGTIPDIEEPAGVIELFDFQRTAVQNAIHKINEYGGVIVADVVGTGKSYIGSMILKYLVEANRSKPLIICPPHLIDMWKEYTNMFDINADVISRYKIGMEDNPLSRYGNCDAILVDESHNFRNRNNAYEALYDFTNDLPDDSCVIMLTATPISNSINDLKNQLRLFPADRISNVQPLGNTDLDEYFKGAEQNHQITPDGEEKIRELLRHILIRRTRKQIQNNHAKKDGDRYYLETESGKKYFPKRNLAIPRQYNIDSVYQDSFEKILEYIADLKLARYTPGNYIKEEYQNATHKQYKKYDSLAKSMASLTGIVRTVLLKRVESSIAAFASSVDNYAQGSRKFLEILKKGTVPIGKDYADIIYKSIMYDDDSYDSGQAGIKSDYNIEAFDVASWKADINDDIGTFEKILRLLPQSSNRSDKNKESNMKRDWLEFMLHDDKLNALLEILPDKKGQKTLLFTESRVTAVYIHDYLNSKLSNVNIGQIDSTQGAREKAKMIKKFDPVNNNADIPHQEQLDILISTDVLSEGVNLQAGKTVINYDFHWNPVRLIQRVGRIDRIGSTHETVDVVNFLPTAKVESELHLKEIVSRKIETIRKIIGHDQKILEPSEDIDADAVKDIYMGNESVLDENAKGILDVIQTEAEQDADRIRTNGKLKSMIDGLPLGIRSSAGNGNLLVACEADEQITMNGKDISTKTFRRYYEVTPEGIINMTASSFLKLLGANTQANYKDPDAAYEAALKKTWNQFTRDMKNEQGRKPLKKIQEYFKKKLTEIAREQKLGMRAEIAREQKLGMRAEKLIPQVTKMMVLNRQPYRNLNDLRKSINKENLDYETIIKKLENIFLRSYEYHKKI